MQGLITKIISNDYTVTSGNSKYICKPRGKFRLDKITPVVGDRVLFSENDNYLLEILPRKNILIRPSVANIDQALIITSVKEPNFSTNLLDKFLTIISYNNIEPIICLTKLDLLNKEELNNLDKYIKYYQQIGYTVITNDDKLELKELIKGKITVLTGQSGSGKSTLLNILDKTLNLKTDVISKALGRGKHTTRHTELFEINKGYVVDTPGFSALDFGSMTNVEIRDNMKDMFNLLPMCKYADCMHIKEDKCAVKKEIETNEILKERYENYNKFLNKK